MNVLNRILLGVIALLVLLSVTLYLLNDKKAEQIKVLEQNVVTLKGELEDLEIKKSLLVNYEKFSYLQFLEIFDVLDKKEEKKDYVGVDVELDFKSFFDDLGGIK